MNTQYPPHYQPGPAPYPPQQPGGYPPTAGHDPYGRPGGSRPKVITTEDMPSGALRRAGGVLVDLLLAASGGAYVAQQILGDTYTSAGRHYAVWLGCALGVSFLNQVVLGWLTRCSVGKFLFFLRFVRAPESDHVPVGGYRRPPFWRLVGRWLYGFTLLVRQAVWQVVGGEAEDDGVGILIVGRRHMLTSR